MEFWSFIKGVFSEPDGTPSSKRIVGVTGGLSLIINMFIYPTDFNVNCVLIMALGALGITGAEKLVTLFKK